MTPARAPEAPAPVTHAVADAAAALGVHRETVAGWLRANADESGERSHIVVGGVQVPAVRVGRRWCVVAAALAAALRGEVAA